ncbi:alpha/beta hydrolase [Ferrimonas marina]|uniref:Uncharacterized protein n=1 Tax=Ferrimonas marina TaxID=299255 RepID=A0A1M5VLH5_9GAMM|nr:alpha/beta hydrolase [Ferrimonas marina]SHH76089.1 hypothetical protein SAMN02745129_2843 [Ferrimonas marina]
MLPFHQVVTRQLGDVRLQAYLHDVTAPVVLTFASGNAALTEGNEHTDNWGFGFLKKRGFNVISFNHIGSQNLFRHTALVAFLAELTPQLERFPERIGYGVSRGAFALGIHADALLLDRILMLMPISTFDDRLAPWEPKAIHHSLGTDWSKGYNDATVCRCPVTLIYDPLYPIDRQHALRFGSAKAHLKIPGVGHHVADALAEMGLLSETVTRYLDNRLDVLGFPAKVRARRRQQRYFSKMAQNPTGKNTIKRRSIIRYHWLRWQCSNMDKVLKRTLSKWRRSLSKRLPMPMTRA